MIVRLFLFLVAHAVADFGLQSDWMAQNKRTSRIVRAMHSLIHGGGVYLVAGPTFGMIETGAHYFIDSWTLANGKRPPLWIDQSMHVICKLAYVGAVAVSQEGKSDGR